MRLQLLAAALVAAGASIASPVHASEATNGSDLSQGARHAIAAQAKQEIRITKVAPEYWRITLHNPPYNIFGPETIPQLNDTITQIKTDPRLKVVVFDSDVPGYFLTNYDYVPLFS